MTTRNAKGQWVPAVPEPFYLGFFRKKCRCDCGERFRSRALYEKHYVYTHIWAGL